MTLQENVSLKPYNTFGIAATSQYFTDIAAPIDLQILLQSGLLNAFPFFILGGGSNVIFSKLFAGVVVKISLKGITVLEETDDSVLVKAAAGEVWNDFVDFCVAHNLYGAENLTAIPGTVGASPVQNVGAYGTEAKDIIESVEAYEILTGKQRIFSNNDCQFDYRSSIFKHELKNKYIVASVTFRLSKQPKLNLEYGAIRTEIEKAGITHPTLADVSRIIAEIREEKLPNPDKIGSAGSFFKNPVIPVAQYEALKERHTTIVAYPHKGEYKIAAGWLIEQCGWKGRQFSNVGVYPKQALVLYNLGDCTGEEVKALANEIQLSVATHFGITLEPEAIFV
jgi:UDP-N-acetylmuramate dehydrogenase